MDNDRKIDITGLCCAVPIIKISKELKDMQSGGCFVGPFG
ncbi:MAG: sulfurtransferase TusA family protein [bacterium]